MSVEYLAGAGKFALYLSLSESRNRLLSFVMLLINFRSQVRKAACYFWPLGVLCNQQGQNEFTPGVTWKPHGRKGKRCASQSARVSLEPEARMIESHNLLISVLNLACSKNIKEATVHKKITYLLKISLQAVFC